MSDTTTKTMRELLERWAAMEPDEFSQDDLNTISDPELLTRMDVQAKIQYAVQAVIVSRGWAVQINSNPAELDGWWAMVGSGSIPWNFSKPASSPAEALLSAYLEALKEAK